VLAKAIAGCPAKALETKLGVALESDPPGD
jgi:hypothetical protein